MRAFVVSLAFLLQAAFVVASQVEVVGSDRQDFRDALLDSNVTAIQVSGNLTLDPTTWSPVIVDRDLLIHGDDSANTTLDFNGTREAVVNDGQRIEWNAIKFVGIPEAESVVVGDYSRYRSSMAMLWPCVCDLGGSTEIFNRTWLFSPSIYPTDTFAKIFNGSPIFERQGPETWVLHGETNATSRIEDITGAAVGEQQRNNSSNSRMEVIHFGPPNTFSPVQGNLTMWTYNVKCTKVELNQTSSAGSASKTQLYVGWQTVLIAIAIAVGIAVCLGAIVFAFRRRIVSHLYLRRYAGHVDDPKISGV